jgi:hypothetical protein
VGLPETGYGGMYEDFPLPGHVNKGMTTDRLLTPKGRQGSGVFSAICDAAGAAGKFPEGGIWMFLLGFGFALVTRPALLDVGILR